MRSGTMRAIIDIYPGGAGSRPAASRRGRVP